jgi:glutathione S-transferase
MVAARMPQQYDADPRRDQATPVACSNAMITLYGIGKVFEGGHGETKDLRVQWALEEMGLEYRFHALDQPAGELDSELFARLSPFRQIPVIDDDGFVMAESVAILLYLAEKAGRLIPADVRGRTTVMQWCFAAASTVAPTLQCIETIAIFDEDRTATKVLAETRKLAARWFGHLERRLEGREWIAHTEFTVADIAMASVLRTIRQTDLMEPFPNITSYYRRCHARPAWQRTLTLAAERLHRTVDELR